MRGFITNIEQETLANDNFRKVLYTAPSSQLVLMSLLPGEEIGLETHTLDQFFRFEKGTGKVVLNGEERAVTDGTAVVVPAGTAHNVINTSPSETLKLYTIYSPPEHKDGVIHATKADALADTTDEYNGVTSVRD
jgi:mannose-6-phosphate isomerase-like protein (cupin superfamily)